MGIKKRIRRFYVSEATAPCAVRKTTYRTQKHDHRKDNPKCGGNVRKEYVIPQRHRKIEASTGDNLWGANSQQLLDWAREIHRTVTKKDERQVK